MDKYLFVFVLLCANFAEYGKADLPDCKKEDLHYEYTECDSSDGRWRVSVPKEPNTCVLKPGVVEPAVRGKSCEFTCKNGHYLDMQTQECKPCSPGTYSLGGGARFEEWDKLPPGFSVKTESFGSIINVKDEDEENCTNTAWMPKGSFVSSVPGECSSSLVYSANLVKPGKVTFDYQYTESNAIFHFTVKNDQCQSYSDRRGSRWPVETEEGKWGHVEVDLKSGLNVLAWKSIGVMSSRTRGSNPKPIRIKQIEISGVAFSSQCTICRNGTYSSEGSAYCHLCEPGTYAVKGQGACTPCDAKSEYSERGSSQCQKKPPCKKQDYYSFQTPCDTNNKTQTKYEWIQPQICRTDISGAVSLPAADGDVKDCPPCNPGMQYIKGQGCVYCTDNHFSDGSKPCLPCPASTSPYYAIEYKWWNSLPQNMTSKCITFTENNCSTATSWTVSGDHIRTQFARDEGAYQVLILRIDGFRAPTENVDNVEVGEVSFIFETSCKSSCELVFLTDEGGHSNIVKEWSGTESKSLYNHNIMSPGPVILTWAFQTDNDDSDTVKDFAKIYSIRVTNTLHGGASSCQKCPKGVDEKKECIPCPDGHYIDENTTQCMPCPKNFIVRTGNSWGIESCEECGPGLHAEKGKRCVTDCSYMDDDGRKYDFTALKSLQYVTGSRLFTASGTEYYHGFNISLCGNEHTQASCVNNMTSGGGKDSSGKVINAMICRSTMVPPRNLESVVSTQPVSLGDYLTQIASNQTHDSDTFKRYQKEGFPVKDVERHVHFYFKSDSKTAACPDGRSTIISLVCDPGEEDVGTIETPPKCADGTCDGCKFHFLWKNKEACPKCRIEDYEKIIGECVNGEQTIHYNPPQNCVIDGKPIRKEQKKCKLKLSALPFVLQISIPIILGLGVILLMMLVYCWHRNRKLEYKYMKLVEGSGPNYDGELPGVDSCALEDGEEEQFDSVSFKDSKSKGLFQKLRGKKKKRDDDENPFDSMHTEKMPLT